MIRYDEETAKNEIAYRNELRKKVKIERLSNEESIWLHTHPKYNWQLGYPYLNIAFENLDANKCYEVITTIEFIDFDGKISPVLYVPLQKGKIIADFEIVDRRGKISVGKPVYMLMLSWEANCCDIVEYQSELGLLQIGYTATYCEPGRKYETGGFSTNGFPNYAMIREVIKDNKIRYYCKSPQSDNFKAMIFTVEWDEINYEKII